MTAIPLGRQLPGASSNLPGRQDPGEKFPWRLLSESGIGLWVNPAPITEGGAVFVLGESAPAIREIQELLGRYGYDIAVSGSYDPATRDVIAAFQRHFRPARVDGVADASTITTLRALLAARAARS